MSDSKTQTPTDQEEFIVLVRHPQTRALFPLFKEGKPENGVRTFASPQAAGDAVTSIKSLRNAEYLVLPVS